MADTPTIWWYPDPNGAEVSIAIPRKAQAVGQRQVVNVSTSETIGGRVHSQTFGAKERIQIEFFGVDGANGEALYRAMIPLVAHLRRGGYCFAAMNTDRGWAAFAKGPAARGDTVIPVQGNLIAGINASGSPATGQVFALGPQPLQWRELHAVSAYGGAVLGSTLTLADGLIYPWSEADWLLFREEFTFPYARIPAAERNNDILTFSPQRVLSVQLPLEVDPDILQTLSGVDLAPTGPAWDPRDLVDDILHSGQHGAGDVGVVDPYDTGWRT